MSDLLPTIWKGDRLRVPPPTNPPATVIKTIIKLDRAHALDAGTGDVLDRLLAAGVAQEQAQAAEAAEWLRARWRRRLARWDAQLVTYETTLRALNNRENELLALGDAEVLQAIEEEES